MTVERPSTESRGFTLLELVVAMGLLSAFLMMLVQIVGTGVGVFDEGERGQELADRASIATRAVRTSLADMVGPRHENFEPHRPTARLLVDWAPTGFSADDAAPTRHQVVRATVRLSGVEEDAILAEYLRERAEDDVGAQGPLEVERRLRELLDSHPRSGRGEMLLLAWPASADGVFFELRKGLFLTDEDLLGEDGIRVMDVELGGKQLSARNIEALTEVIASRLLHIEFQFWSQHTRDWRGIADGSGPEYVWDSARAGLLVGGEDPRAQFSMDIGPGSLRDTRDDVFPRWIRVTMTVARGANLPPDAVLRSGISSGDTAVELSRTDELPDPEQSKYLKIGAEWVRYANVNGRTLTGVQRGLRGTTPKRHPAGASVRSGREVQLVFKVPHGRDSND